MNILYAYFIASLLIIGLATWNVWGIYEQFYPTMLFISTSKSFHYVS